MSFEEFDDATPRMVQLFIIAYGRRAEERQQQLTLAAWHGARFGAAVQVEPGLGVDELKEAWDFGKPPKPKTWAEESAKWSAFFDGIRAQHSARNH